jgi:hypothetical protein
MKEWIIDMEPYVQWAKRPYPFMHLIENNRARMKIKIPFFDNRASMSKNLFSAS